MNGKLDKTEKIFTIIGSFIAIGALTISSINFYFYKKTSATQTSLMDTQTTLTEKQDELMEKQNEITENLGYINIDLSKKANEISLLQADMESYGNKISITQIFIDDYIQGNFETQLTVLYILREVYPNETLELENILEKYAFDKKIKAQVISSSDAITLEIQGFNHILEGDLSKAREYFGRAYYIEPTLHMIDEIYNEVLTDNVVNDYDLIDEFGKKQKNKEIIENIYNNYSWGMGSDIKNQFKQYLEFYLGLNNLFSEEESIRKEAVVVVKNIMLGDPISRYLNDMFLKIKEEKTNIYGRSNVLYILSKLDSLYLKNNSELILKELYRILQEDYGIAEKTQGWIEEIRNKINN